MRYQEMRRPLFWQPRFLCRFTLFKQRGYNASVFIRLEGRLSLWPEKRQNNFYRFSRLRA